MQYTLFPTGFFHKPSAPIRWLLYWNQCWLCWICLDKVNNCKGFCNKDKTLHLCSLKWIQHKNDYTKSCTDDWLHTISIMRSSEPDASISPSWLKLSVLTGQLQRYKTMIMQGIGARINLHMTFNKCNLTVFLYLIRFYLKEKVFKFFTHTLHYYS